MVSWFVKRALLNVATDCGVDAGSPVTREDWARLAQKTGVKGIHIAERDTQRAKAPKPMGVFVNTWSVEGFISEGLQPAELGWARMRNICRPKASGIPSGRLRDLSDAAGRGHARAVMDSDRPGAAWLAHHP